MTFFAGWLTVFLISVVVVITPGPDFALTLRNSLAFSRRAGVYTAIGLGFGNLVHATYSILGIAAIISRSILFFNLLKWVGAAYLIYLGIKSLRTKKAGSASQIVQRRKDISRWAAFRIGFLGNVLNPKAPPFFFMLFTQIIQPTTPIAAQVVYGSTVAVVALVWFVLVAVLISQRAVRERILSFSHWLERLMGAFLVGLGLRLAVAEPG
ncbi:LysE family transporter [Oscillatoria sp. FACHB-1407]|uniref:LysE family translocator n=1 Tax=Oscillatoria sp. FACHB-1407 TaxID=2692847 RepID=UPI0016853008|nr:LysE family transporter [Oscillatoria sp. FACHB-1407]MBD2459612.1 LysE family transporter [Oscillatoria sp. FACHB-1407]